MNVDAFVQLRHVEDDSTIMWAVGPDSGVIAKRAQICGDEIEIVVPFEGANCGEVQYLTFVSEDRIGIEFHTHLFLPLLFIF